LNADALGKLFESGIVIDAAGVGGGLGEDGEGKVAVFGVGVRAHSCSP
jgi:hypothetical protein